MKTTAIICGLIITLSIGYYFFIFLPDKQNYYKETKCYQDGKNYLTAFSESLLPASRYIYTYRFTPDGTCLIKFGDDKDDEISFGVIRDLYNGKNIYRYRLNRYGTNDCKVDGCLSKEEFEYQEQELFN